MNFISAVIVAGGSGSRMGRPKQMLNVAGTPVLTRSINAFKAVPGVKEIIVVTTAEVRAELEKTFDNLHYALPGDTRLISVINGVAKTAAEADIILVHDGARPLVVPEDITKGAELAFEHGASVLAVPVKDTIKQVDGGTVVVKTLERGALYAAQTPQCYKADIIRQALAKFGADINATDESQLVEKLGVKVVIVPSSYKNIKITTPEDLLTAEAFVNEDKNDFIQRTGIGFDLHRLVEGRKLFIGGLEIPHSKGFLGHSDGDVVLHAVCDAALGAVCAGEIGIYYPPTDAKIEGISSVTIAKRVLEILKEKHAEIVHIDATIITEEPKMKPHYAAITQSMASVFDVPAANINFKSKSHERLGDIGAGNAAMCQCVVTVKIKQ
ncbi:2-C-methyl-D-erythritol 4-phosphate cytidylyltransferase/2-C-methyl-D-erythritol 2 [Elusimicrobium simillimum]|uniref:2-C-methyl-D-erythritol 4-phosphate cytidylyltransferase n=1 Tax=Elusimicrobium simillimum TaxID=3143438 RepID=UPI003C6F392E